MNEQATNSARWTIRALACIAIAAVAGTGCLLDMDSVPLKPPSASDGKSPDRAADARTGLDRDTRRPVDLGGASDRSLLGHVPGEFVELPAASFQMGKTHSLCTNDFAFCWPAHTVVLTHRLLFSTTEVTREQFDSVMGARSPADGGYQATGQHPVGPVTWHEAAAYCNGLSSRAGLPPFYHCTRIAGEWQCQEQPEYQLSFVAFYTGRGFRLPTEAEWEYAARAGSAHAYYNGAGPADCEAETDSTLDQIAWYRGNTAGTKPVKTKAPNAFGLYDMLGNVAEWVNDAYELEPRDVQQRTDPIGPPSASAAKRVVRGCGFDDPPAECGACLRTALQTIECVRAIGFRCVRLAPAHAGGG